MCREALRRYQKKCHIFTAKIGPTNREGRLVLRNVKLLRDDGVILGGCDHLCVSQKPFKELKKGTNVRFTGKIFKYERADCTIDYSVKVNKVKNNQAVKRQPFCLLIEVIDKTPKM